VREVKQLVSRNRGDLDDVPDDVREKMTFHPVMTVDEALAVALEPARPTVPAA
jgi:ATP-dependent Lon protease